MADTLTGGNQPFDIQGLYDMYGQETVAELLQMSVDESRGLLDQMIAGSKERDSKLVLAAAHQLKGLASTMTINELAKLSLELESSARNEQWESIGETLKRLESEYQRTAKYISEVLG